VSEAAQAITQEKVETLAFRGCTVQEMADILGVSRQTMYDSWKPAILQGRAKRHSELRQMQWEAAKKGNATLLIWLGKNDLGQSDYGSHETDEEQSPYKE